MRQRLSRDYFLGPCAWMTETGSSPAVSMIGETGFEPATARPPAGAIQAYPLLFGALEPSELR